MSAGQKLLTSSRRPAVALSAGHFLQTDVLKSVFISSNFIFFLLVCIENKHHNVFICIFMSLYIQRLNFLLQTSAIALVYMEQASGFLKTVQKMILHPQKNTLAKFSPQNISGAARYSLSLISFIGSKAVSWFRCFLFCSVVYPRVVFLCPLTSPSSVSSVHLLTRSV